MHRIATTFILSSLAVGAFAQFTAGNLVVVTVGPGFGTGNALTNQATPVALNEFTTSGTPTYTLNLPTAGADRLTLNGTATTEGYVQRTLDGQYIVIAGYSQDAGAAGNVAQVTGVLKVLGRVNASGTFERSPEITDALVPFASGTVSVNVRSATSTNGTDFWLSGVDGGTGAAFPGGIRYYSWGNTTSTEMLTTPGNMRCAKVFDLGSGPQLFVGAMTGAFRGVNTVGTGAPTTNGQTLTLLPGFDPATNSPQSTYDYYFADANTLYVADDRANPTGGIQKWVFNSGTNVWELQYTLNSGLSTGVRGLCAETSAGVTTLYATTTSSNNNALVAVTDLGASSAFSTLATAGTNVVFRGLAFAPSSGSPASLGGKVSLEGWVGSYDGLEMTVEVRPVGGTSGSAIQTETVTLDANGDFSFGLDGAVTPGDYDITCKGAIWLRAARTTQTISGTGATGQDFTLLAGDSDDNNEVSLIDFDNWSAAFDTVVGDAGYNANADFDGSGDVGLLDYDLWGMNYDKLGHD